MLNILIPMSGLGKRFIDAGYKDPKPFIDILGKPMIQRVVESLKLDGRYIFITQHDYLVNYNGYEILNRIAPKCIIITLDKQTEGAACTCLKAKEIINNEQPLVIANSDQIINYNAANFFMYTNYYDGCILTFPVKNDPKWSYVEYNGNMITNVVEKVPISDKGNVGLYSWSRGKDFVASAESMIKQNFRTNNEFYIAPTYNELIKNKYYITWQDAIEFMPCGTPEDLKKTIEKIK